MSSNELERIYNQVRIVDDPFSTSQICANLFENNLFGFRVYCSLEISCLKNYSVYNNDELKITLIVIFENRLMRWLSMSKKLSIRFNETGTELSTFWKMEELS
mgnify:CR=1 FL=1